VIRGPLLIFGVVLTLAGICAAEPRLQVQRGWGGTERAGRWNLITVRVSNPAPLDVILELLASTDGGFATVTHEHVAIGPSVSTFELFAPKHYSLWEKSVLVLRDAQTERMISQFPQHLRQPVPQATELGPQEILIGISGQVARLEMLAQSGAAQSAYLPPHLLPREAMGFDALEILFLNKPNLVDLDIDQQHAILNWVRAGGSMLFTPGDGPVPQDSPILAALPCQIGTIAQIDLNPQELAVTGLRETHLVGRALTPSSPTSYAVHLLENSGATAWSERYGLGQILVAPIDLGALEFQPEQGDKKVAAFWQPILSELATVPPVEGRRKFDAPYFGRQSESEDQQREGAATSTLADLVSGNPGSGHHHVPFVVLGMLLIIGPIDSIVLFAMGRRPWTLITTGGWMGLIVLGAFFASSFLRTPEVAYGRVRVIEQVDDAAVASTDLVGISSQSDGANSVEPLDATSPGWWQPIIPGLVAPENVHAQFDARFHQTDSGDVPEQQILGAGEARFLRADKDGPGPAIVAASISKSAIAQNPPRLIGTIKNLSDRPINDLRIRTKVGVLIVPLPSSGTLAPQQIISIDFLATTEPFDSAKSEARYQSYGYFGSHHDRQPVNETDMWAVAPDLSARRSWRIDQLLQKTSDFACIYAQFVDPTLAATLHGRARPVERHYQYLRALVPLRP
jgi:hypothetical protein